MMLFITSFEKIIIRVLVTLMAFVLLLSTVELAWVIIKDIITSPILILEIDELLEIFGLFMLVLTGIELLETIAKTCMAESTNHAQIVKAVAIIASTRKVIILDENDLSGLVWWGLPPLFRPSPAVII